MFSLQSPLLTTLLGLAAMFLAISLLVQVLQELYKYLRNSKATAYQSALVDYLGPWAGALMRPSPMPDVRVRGPMQWRRLRPSGKILPLNKDTLVDCLERTAPSWVQRAVDQLSLETELQSGRASSPSPNWNAFTSQLGAAEQGTSGYWSAHDIAMFLQEWGHTWKQKDRKRSNPGHHPILALGELTPPQTLDASAMLKAFRTRFLPDVDHAADNFAQFQANFDYTYRRRNIRLTCTLAFLVAVLCDLPIGTLWDNAARLDPQTAAKYAESVIQLSQEKPGKTGTGDSSVSAQVEMAKKIAQHMVPDTSATGGDRWMSDLVRLKGVGRIWSSDVWSDIYYVLGCFLTAILVTFGAPFWNDIASALLRLQKGTPHAGAEKEDHNG